MTRFSKDSTPRTTEDRPLVMCGHEYCHSKALIHVDGEGNLCREHYDNHHMSEALKWNAKNRLDTVEKRKAFVSRMIRPTIAGMAA